MKVSITRKTMALLFLASLPLFAVNVMDFGAKGDGFSDDTDAIQLAMNAASKQMTFALAGRSESPRWGGHGGHGHDHHKSQNDRDSFLHMRASF